MSAKGESLVLIGAHADDVELHAGGVAAMWARSGRPVHIVMTTNNMSGNLLPEGEPDAVPHRLPPAQTQAVRQREQEAAAAVIGASVTHLNYPQRHYWNGERQVSLTFDDVRHDRWLAGHANPPLVIAAQQPEVIEAVGELIVSLGPAAVVTQTITDIDPEHHATASLVWQAFNLRRSDLAGVTLACWAPGTSSAAGMLKQSFDCIVPLNEQNFEAKMTMLRCHASQMTTRRLTMAEHGARYWGAEIGAAFAEPLTTLVNGRLLP